MSSASRERGSAAVEFVLVALPMVATFVATISITLYSYLRTVMLESTMEGARYAALADQNLNSGMTRSRTLIEGVFGPIVGFEITGGEYSIGETEIVRLQGTAKLQSSGFTGIEILSVESVATREPN